MREEETMKNKLCARQSVCLFVRLFVSLFWSDLRDKGWHVGRNRGCLM